MKIIASRHGYPTTYIVEATGDELARVMGKVYSGAQGVPELKPGTVVDVDAAYELLGRLRTMAREVSAAAGHVGAVVDLLKYLPDKLTGLLQEPEPPAPPEPTAKAAEA